MKIDDKIANYEITKFLPQSTSKTSENMGGKQPTEEQRVEGNEAVGQDTIVHLSQASKEAQQIQEIISSEPDVREEKVSAIKEQIESGRYKIDNEAVANNLVDALLDEI